MAMIRNTSAEIRIIAFVLVAVASIACLLFSFVVPSAEQLVDLPQSDDHHGEAPIVMQRNDEPVASTHLQNTATRAMHDEMVEAVKKFEASIKSCLGSNCFDERSVGVNPRIGFLTPDAHGVDKLLDLVLLAGKKAKLLDGKRVAEISTHTPAYGYGKNHGWSRIVRIVSMLPEHALKILERNNLETKSPSLYTYQLEQLMRWHCRLNHVAAHSSMLSIFIEDFLERPVVELYKILSFMGIRPSQIDIEEALGQEAGKQAISALSENFGAVPQEQVADAISQITSTTKRLSKWPCDSFRELDSSSGGMLPIPCNALHPDCDSKLVSCLPIDKRAMCDTGL